MVSSDLAHTLAFIRAWGRLPANTVVIEVEPDDIELAGFNRGLFRAGEQLSRLCDAFD